MDCATQVRLLEDSSSSAFGINQRAHRACFFDRRGARDREPRDRPRPIAASTPRHAVINTRPHSRTLSESGWTPHARERPSSVVAATLVFGARTLAKIVQAEETKTPPRPAPSRLSIHRGDASTPSLCALCGLEKYNIEKDIAAFIKKEFDKKYNPTWHCNIGRNFGSYVTHETKPLHLLLPRASCRASVQVRMARDRGARRCARGGRRRRTHAHGVRNVCDSNER